MTDVGRTAPRVSVGLPVYNGDNYLERALRSLLAQDYGDFELIVSDNASTDRTEEIVRDYAASDPRVRYDRAERNLGAAWNFSRLPGMARGELFRWAAHDDENDPSMLGRCVEVLDADADVVLVYPRAVFVDEAGEVTQVEDQSPVGTPPRTAARAVSLLSHRAFPAAAPFGLTRRAQVLRTDLLRPYKGSDRTFLLQLALMGRFHEIPETLFRNRRHPDRSAWLPRQRWQSWWDGGPDGRRVYPRSRLLREYASAVARADAPVTTRAAVLGYLPVWAARNGRPLAREALGAGAAAVEGIRRPAGAGAGR